MRGLLLAEPLQPLRAAVFGDGDTVKMAAGLLCTRAPGPPAAEGNGKPLAVVDLPAAGGGVGVGETSLGSSHGQKVPKLVPQSSRSVCKRQETHQAPTLTRV